MTPRRPNPGPGAAGFEERGEPALALGSVTGVRVFDFGGSAASPFLRDPGGHRAGVAGLDREPGELAGQHGGSWQDGENLAECIRDGEPTGHVPPHDGCGCGFWNYWQMDTARLVFNPDRPVLAVIEGYGRTKIGDRGFRCAKARIVALHLAFDFIAPGAISDGGWRSAFTEPETARDNDALKSECEQYLAGRYPSARLYATQAAMLAMHPPTRDYLPHPDPPSISRQVERAIARRSVTPAVPASAPPGLRDGLRAMLASPAREAVIPLGNPPPGWPGRIIRGR